MRVESDFLMCSLNSDIDFCLQEKCKLCNLQPAKRVITIITPKEGWTHDFSFLLGIKLMLKKSIFESLNTLLQLSITRRQLHVSQFSPFSSLLFHLSVWI